MRPRNPEKELLVKQKAIELLGRDGFEGFSVNKLAKACTISVATIYIYYKDKDDLIVTIAQEEAKKMALVMVRGLNAGHSFYDGLRLQWKNRYDYLMGNPSLGLFFDQLRSSTYQQQFTTSLMSSFESTIKKFMQRAEERGELVPMPLEVFWSIAFAPLYSLIRFHHEGKYPDGRPFKMTETLLWQSFDLVFKALKP